MATLSPYSGLLVETGVRLDPAGVRIGEGGLTLEPQEDGVIELYTTLNALAPAPNETDATTGFASTVPPSTFVSIMSTDSAAGGNYMLSLSENVANNNFREAQDLATQLSLASETVYLFSVRASWGGVGGASDDVEMKFGADADLGNGPASYVIAILIQAGGDDTFVEYNAILYLSGSNPLEFFGWREFNGNNIGSAKTSVVSITQPNTALGVELNTIGNATSPTNEMNAITGWTGASGGVVASIASTDGQGGSFMLRIDGAGGGWRATTDIQTDFSLVDGVHYLLAYRAAHDGTGIGNAQVRIVLANNINISGSATIYDQDLIAGQTAFQDFSFAFTHKTGQTRFFGAREDNANNDGAVFISVVSVKEITLS